MGNTKKKRENKLAVKVSGYNLAVAPGSFK